MNENLYIPPHDQTLEQCVLGSMIMENRCIDELNLSVNDFYQQEHRAICQAILDEYQANKKVDIAIMRKREDFDFAYMIELANKTPSAANFNVYQKRVKELSVLRALIGATHDIADTCFSNPRDIETTLADASNLIAKVTESYDIKETDTSAKAACKETIEALHARVQSNSELIGISTGFEDLDKSTGGLEKGGLYVLAARPGMGKTTLAMNIVDANILEGGNPLVFSIEMPREQLIQRMVSNRASVPLGAIRSPKSLDDYQWAGITTAMKEIGESNMHIVDDGVMTIPRMRMAAHRHKKMFGSISLIIVDYMQIINPPKAENRTGEITKISNGLKAIAKEFHVPVLALSQLNRDLEKRRDKRPMSSDLRESGSIEQDADGVFFIYQDQVYNEDTLDEGLAEIIIGKGRNFQMGTVFTEFDGAYSRFSSTNRVSAGSKPKSYQERFSA